MDIIATINIVCKNCNKEIEHHYSENDLQKYDSFEFICQNCGEVNHIKTDYLRNKIIEDVESALKKNLGLK